MIRIFLLIVVFFTPFSLAGEIALTFDDAPTPGIDTMDGEMRTKSLIRQLREAEVPQALFFVTTEHINKVSAERLRAYTQAGHWLGNHSHQHISANELSVEAVLEDTRKAKRLLEPFDNVLPLYRFPYLHHGKDAQSREAIGKGLQELGYSLGYVTVDNYDWYINSLYVEAVKAGKTVDMERLGKLYVDTLWEAIQFYDAIANKALGRSPKHVLLLHENDIAAAFVGDLVRHIRANGWKIISPQEAYMDPISQQSGDLDFTKQGRVAALAHKAGMATEELRHPSENTDYLDTLFEQYKIVSH